ncbi:UpxY family transcription antiterminator [Mucilaginibacter panaciglaebae]|uniref:Transcription antitermination factor NusG n=1 Tax=Mucilaginibacter panaciglaebae TaxID=502331 RepID=A0ABP7WEU2_9SPHI
MQLVHTSHPKKLEKHWMVIYTRPRWEKKVDYLLQAQGIESYCPLTKVRREWSDREKMVEIPLFSSYIFVNVNIKQQAIVRQTLGVLNFVYFQGKPATIAETVIEDIRHYTSKCEDLQIVSINDLSVGDRVKIKKGAFANHQGDVLEIQGKHLLMVLDNLGCLLIAKVPVSNIVTA